MRGRARGGIVAAIVVGLSLSCGAITHDELACEEAVSRLSDCCPGLDTRGLSCVDSSGGCSGEAKPTVTSRASSCVLGKSCSDLGGACSGVIAYAQVPDTLKDTSVLESEVCP